GAARARRDSSAGARLRPPRRHAGAQPVRRPAADRGDRLPAGDRAGAGDAGRAVRGHGPRGGENLATRLRDLRDALGRTVLLIEHNVPLVLDTCDYVYVLDAGKLIAEGEPRAIAANQDVIDAYFGRAVSA